MIISNYNIGQRFGKSFLLASSAFPKLIAGQRVAFLGLNDPDKIKEIYKSHFKIEVDTEPYAKNKGFIVSLKRYLL